MGRSRNDRHIQWKKFVEKDDGSILRHDEFEVLEDIQVEIPQNDISKNYVSRKSVLSLVW